MAIWKKGFEEQKKHLRKIGIEGRKKAVCCVRSKASLKRQFTKEHQSNAGKNSRLYENMIAQKLNNIYDKVYLPNEVCDRIVVKNRKVQFVEIKRKNKIKLTQKQKEFQDITKNDYIILTE